MDSTISAVIDRYKRDLDRTLLRRNLRKTPDQRVRDALELLRLFHEVRLAAERKKDQ